MTKLSFLLSLRDMLSDLPQDDVEERLRFYSEMIEDRMEEGLSEEDAVAAIGSVEEIAAQITTEIPRTGTAAHPTKPKRRTTWEIILLALGSPIWLSLLIAAFVVIFALYVSIWAVVISFWAIFAALAGCAFGIIIAGSCFALNGNGIAGIAMIGAGFVCAGFAILLFFGCKALTKGSAWLTKKTGYMIKRCFKRRENA